MSSWNVKTSATTELQKLCSPSKQPTLTKDNTEVSLTRDGLGRWDCNSTTRKPLLTK